VCALPRKKRILRRWFLHSTILLAIARLEQNGKYIYFGKMRQGLGSLLSCSPKMPCFSSKIICLISLDGEDAIHIKISKENYWDVFFVQVNAMRNSFCSKHALIYHHFRKLWQPTVKRTADILSEPTWSHECMHLMKPINSGGKKKTKIRSQEAPQVAVPS